MKKIELSMDELTDVIAKTLASMVVDKPSLLLINNELCEMSARVVHELFKTPAELTLKELLDNAYDVPKLILLVNGCKVGRVSMDVARSYEDKVVSDWEYDEDKDTLTVNINLESEDK